MRNILSVLAFSLFLASAASAAPTGKLGYSCIGADQSKILISIDVASRKGLLMMQAGPNAAVATMEIVETRLARCPHCVTVFTNESFDFMKKNEKMGFRLHADRATGGITGYVFFYFDRTPNFQILGEYTEVPFSCVAR